MRSAVCLLTKSAAYDADLGDLGGGSHEASLWNTELSVRSPDPEYDLCFAMVRAGLPDGEIQFWRHTTPTLRFRSVHQTAQYRVELGGRFPYCRRKRRAGENLEISRTGVRQDGDLREPVCPGADTG
jgi:hypothetical protein